MKGHILSAVAIVLLGSTSLTFASHQYHRPVYKDVVYCVDDWTGFYAGLNAGYAWGSQTIDQTSNSAAIMSAINANAIPPSLAGRPAGPIGGAQVGYNYQISRAVLGVEGDYQIANIENDGSNTSTVPGFLAFSSTARQQLQSLATLRGRLGYAPLNSLLLYVTAGFAYGHTQLSGSVTNPGCIGFCGSSSSSSSTTGWAAGAGAEYMFTTDWSARLEYLYYDLGGQSQQIRDNTTPSTFIAQKMNFEGNLVRAAINYKFM